MRGQYPPMELLVDLPFKSVNSDFFKMKKGDIEGVVQLLSRMKSLDEINIFQNDKKGYKLTVAEFSMFKDLPVKRLQLEALSLTVENLNEFRQIMKEMEIEEIDWQNQAFPDLNDRLVINSFGPDGAFKTI